MAGAAIFGCAGPVLSPAEASFFRTADPWGFILFARNIESAAQVIRLTNDLRAAVGRDAAILIDQEGGRVQRLRPPLARDWLPPLDQVRASPRDRAAHGLYLRYRIIAAELRGLGIDANCAPVADIAGPGTHPFLRNRCLGETAAEVAAHARAVAEGLAGGGVVPVLKHAPGHGRAGTDSHKGLPRVTATRAELEATDFAPFAALADLPMAMTAHVVYPALDPDRPATLSPVVIDLLRHRIGLTGLLLTDDISMGALSGSVAARSAAARAAGCDIVLHCNGDAAEMAAVADAAGTLEGAAAARADAALAARHSPAPVDMAALEAEFRAILPPA